MRKKSLFYLTSTAILIAASSHQVFAAESVKASTSETTVELNKQEADSSPKFQTKEATHTSPVNQVTSSSSSENEVTDSSTALTEAKASKEKSVVKENPVVANETKKDNKSTFFAAQNNQATARSNTDAQVKKSTFVDVSSHNGYISKEDYQRLAEKGVSGAVVKLTEGTSYKNPYAISQAQNAQAAGMQVSAYAFSHYTNEAEARAEARYFAEEARRLNLPSSTVMVNDIEDSDMLSNINTSTQAWADEMRRMGFSNLMYYTSASWLDRNNLRTKGPIQTERFGLENFWVAQYPTSKLSADDAKTLKYNSEAGAWQFTSQAELLPGRHVFDQSVDYTGRFTGNAPIAKDALSGTITIANNNPETGTFDVIVSNVGAPYGVREVKVPIWSSVNGQDDIIWYTAARQSDGTYKVTVKASNHKNSVGEYNIHLYYVQNDGQLIGVTGTKTTVSIGKPKGTITIQNNNPNTGTFDVIVSGVSNPAGGVKTVSVPIWSSVNGQDDIIWYTAARQADGTYKVTVKASNHKNSVGEYNIHLYYVQNDGQLIGVGGTKTNVSIAKPQGKITIANNNPETGTFDVIVSGVSSPYGVREVKLPTWSSVNGQDDIIWYTAARQSDGTYKVTVKATDHKRSTGEYNIHLYYVQHDGQLVGVTGTTTTVSMARPKGTLTITNNNPNAGTFDVIVSGVSSPDGVREVKLPTWSNVDGQDDIIWYTAIKQANGTYKTTVKVRDHKYSTGIYNVHLYYIQDNGQIVGVAGTQTVVSLAKPQGQISIQNNNPDTGTFDVIVSGVSSPYGVREVKLPTWSSVNGQDDIIWYTATKQANGTYKVTVKASDHKNSTGLYYVHLYYVQNNGTLIGVGGTSTNVTISPEKLKPTGKITIQNNNPNTGTFEVVVSNVFSPNGVREVKLPTWSSVNGQDDVSWYTATKQADGTYKLFVNASNHKNSTGEYNVHLYYVQNDGQLVGVGGIKLQVSKRVYETPYYSQRDSRWAGRTYGGYTFAATGCVPTTVAMAISGITGQTVLPTTVADYLYHSTNEFNKRSYGTTSHGIVLAARHWGLKTETLGSTAAVREALAMGHHVLGAVGTSVFANYPVTHELIMKGYNNGMTYVMDPYNASNNGYYSVDYLFRVRSLDPTDNTEGSPFMTIRA
ncbi:GBS Bsp-like repeat-containing protein [Streptococcus constellatus]|uniref:GBS Bsp-like repeat-containing protein n=3 Tax=Streptococcus constellatus TaxID=76860 RepID=UPI0022E6DCD6|nr:GBS Bsp-like repeat-containing protein [Streptococcus constellatus]